MADDAPVWVLLGQKTGDNNQLLRLASELGLRFRAIELRYNGLYRIPPQLLGPSLATLKPDSRAEILPPWPRLVLGIGNRSVPVALAIRRASGGKSKLVRLGNPRMHPRNFDLVITTRQYRVPDAPNLLSLPFGISTAPRLNATREEQDCLGKIARPHRLLLVGGETFMWTLTPEVLSQAAKQLGSKPGGSVIAVSSPRTGEAAMDAIAEALRGSEHALVEGRFPRYPVLLEDADEIHVTADSVAMVSDAVATGKPVGIIRPQNTLAGQLFYSLKSVGLPVPVRDIEHFWKDVQSRGHAGTVEAPLAATVETSPLETAVSAVRALLED